MEFFEIEPNENRTVTESEHHRNNPFANNSVFAFSERFHIAVANKWCISINMYLLVKDQRFYFSIRLDQDNDDFINTAASDGCFLHPNPTRK